MVMMVEVFLFGGEWPEGAEVVLASCVTEVEVEMVFI